MLPMVPVLLGTGLTIAEATKLFTAGVAAGTTAVTVAKKKRGGK